MIHWLDALLAPWRREAAAWLRDARELGLAHWRLAALEARAAAGAVRRFGIVAVIGVALVVAGLPLVALVCAEQLAEATGGDRTWWILGLGTALATIGGLLAWTAWRRLRRDLAGLTDTLAELREDAAWLQELFTDDSAER